MKLRFHEVVALSLLLVSALTTTGLAATKYDIADLGAGVIPSAINQEGDVVGTIVSAAGGPEAFLYSNGVVMGVGQLGGTGSWGLAINDYADMAGSICMDDVCKENPYWGLQRHGFIQKKGQVTDLMTTTGMMEAAKINNSDVILGEVDPNTLPEDCSAEIILYDHISGNVTDSILSCGEDTRPIYPSGLNDLGEAIFIKSYCGSWECSTSYLYSGGDLQALPADLPDNTWIPWSANDINNYGQIVGKYGYDQGVLYSQSYTIIPDVHRLRFIPEAINNQGVMVGRALDMTVSSKEPPQKPKWLSPKWDSKKPIAEYSRPATYADNRLLILQELLTKADDQWILEWVFDLNDKGQIVGYGTKNGEPEHGFILTPVKVNRAHE